MKRILTSFALVAASLAFSQVSISGETNDTPKATLDVKAIDNGKANGILIPRVTKAVADAMPNPENASAIEESTLIYITGEVSGNATNYATNVDANGFYYFKDGKWVKLGGGAAGADTSLYAADGNINGGDRVVTQNNNNVTYTTGTGEFIIDGTSRLSGGSYVKTTVVGSSTNQVTEYDVTADDYYIAVQSTANQVRVNLPLPENSVGRVLIISNDAARNIAIKSGGVQAFNGTDSPSIGKNRAMWMISDGKRWYNLINY